MPTVRTHDAVLAFEVVGTGPPVVFVNGWGLGAGYWELAVERLSPRYRCVVYDPRGVGRSFAGDVSTFEPDEHADDLLAVCEAADAYDAHLVGHELGGRVATIAVRRHPQIATTLTVVGWWGAARIQEALGDFARLRKAASLLLHDLGSYPVVRNLVAWSYRRVPEPRRTQLFEEFASLDARTAYMTAEAADDPEASIAFEEALVRLALPVLLVQGGEDREAARLGLRGIFRRLDHVDFATIHGSGPLPMLEHPNSFARTLAQFFAEHAS